MLNEARSFFYDGDLAAEAPVHLAEFEADVAAADDEQVRRQEIHVHHAAVGEVRDLVEAGHVGDDGPSADIDVDARGGENLVVYGNFIRGFEARLALMYSAVVEAPDPLFDAGARSA